MRVRSLLASDLGELEVQLKSLAEKPELLFLIGVCSVEELKRASALLKDHFSDVERVGLTVAAAVRRGRVIEKGFVLVIVDGIPTEVFSSFSSEERTAGEEIGNYFLQKRQGFLLLFTDGVKTQGEVLVEEIKKRLRIPLIGAKASTANYPIKTAVFHNGRFSERGTVAIYVDYDDFKPYSIFDWKEIGKEFLITESEGNRVYSINHFPAVEFYRHYLGDPVAERLPFTGIEFPLILFNEGEKVARACIERHDDGSLSFAGRVPQASYVRLGCGDLMNRKETLASIEENIGNYDFYLLFPCIARWNFLGEEAVKELQLLRGKESVGFFTFGEFFEGKLLNETLTAVALKKGRITKRAHIAEEPAEENPLVLAITHFLSRISEEYSLLSDAIDNNDFGILILSDILGKKRCIYASKSLERITGYSVEDFILGNVNHTIVYGEDLKKVEGLMEAFRKGEKAEAVLEYRIVTAGGRIKWIRSFAKSSGDTLILSITDISAEKEVEFLAIKDPLTKLYNRQFALEAISKLVEKNRRDGSYSAVLFMDIDRFKLINDVYGHDVGDEILKVVAERIMGGIRGADIPCRFGGDEFLVVLPDLGVSKRFAERRAKEIAKRLVEQISKPILLGGKEFIVTTSIGIVLFSSEIEASDAVKFADIAMYTSKENGRNRITVFSDGLKEKARKLEVVERELKKEVLNRSFNVFYQPIVRLNGGLKLVGFEVLTRFKSKKLSSFSLSYLIKLVEENGLIDNLTLGVIEKACSFLISSHMDGIKISVNVSYRDLMSDEFLENMEETIKSFGIAPSRLTIEITERVFAEDYHAVKEVLDNLKTKGFSIAIDDFGTGYSCLAYLQELPIDVIKVDRTFITGIVENEKKKHLVEAINFLGKSLGMSIVAEGVEEEGEMEVLKKIGIDMFQGYLFAPPVEESKAKELLGSLARS